MAGTKAGGLKAKKKNLEKYGEDYYVKLGAKGGSVSCAKGFAKNPELAKKAGKKGGTISKRGKALR